MLNLYMTILIIIQQKNLVLCIFVFSKRRTVAVRMATGQLKCFNEILILFDK